MNATHLFACDGSGQKSVAGSSAAGSASSGPSASASPAVLDPASECVFLQGWMLMSMAVSIFVPRDSRILWFLRAHFDRSSNPR